MTYSASVEWIAPNALILRIHEGPSCRLGDPYVWCATVVSWPLRTAMLKAVACPLPRGAARALNDALWGEGYRSRCHERRHDVAVGGDCVRRYPLRVVTKRLRPPRETRP